MSPAVTKRSFLFLRLLAALVICSLPTNENSSPSSESHHSSITIAIIDIPRSSKQRLSSAMAHNRPTQSGDQPVYGNGPSNTTPYPAYDAYPDPRQYQSPNAPPCHTDPTRSHSRSRANSGPRPYANDSSYPSYSNHAAQPVYDAVDSAFSNTSTAPTHVPEEVIQKITEQVRSQVIHTLKSEGFGSSAASSASAPPQQFFPPPPASFFPQSPTTSTTNSIPTSRNIHTPPSPARRDSTRASTPDAPAQDPLFFDGSFGKEDLSSRYGDRSGSDVNRRPTAPRLHTDDEETVVEKMWQPLFDARGEPTARLGQFLRGLALDLVSCILIFFAVYAFYVNNICRLKTMSPRNHWLFRPPSLGSSMKRLSLKRIPIPGQVISSRMFLG